MPSFWACRPHRVARSRQIRRYRRLPRHPEENIRQVEHIRFVMKEGVVYR